MKKRICPVLLCVLLLTGCGGRAVDPASLGPALLEGAGFPQGMVVLEEEMAGSIFQIDLEEVTACYAAVSGGAGSDEVLVLTAADEDGAKEILDLLSHRIAYRQESFADYNPDEAAKLEEALLIREGRAVIYCVCPDPDAAEEIAGG